MYKKLSLLVIIFATLTACSKNVPPAAAIATAHPLATAAGFEILDKGGNAFDAAVAVSATLAVVEPYSSGIGGGGFWLLKAADTQRAVMIDGREKAPLQAHRRMYQDEQGNVIPGLSVDGALAAGIPGEPAALVHIANNYGSLPLAVSLAPAIRAAREGFVVTPHYQRMAGFRLAALQKSPAAAEIFLLDNAVPPLGHVIKQHDLANTLHAIATKGHGGFYRGEVAAALVQGTQAAGGIWTTDDLEKYQVVERQPVTGVYRDYKITSAAPPSSGGVALLSILNMLEKDNLASLEPVMRKHLLVEAMRRAYRDRAEYLGDTDFVDVPVLRLTSKSYAATLRSTIRKDKATDSHELRGVASLPGGNHTTHLSILDRQGNQVAATLSVNYPFGACFVAPGTGVLLNDEMDDFSAKPGVPNVYGLVGAEANAIEPGKRMLSSMSPTFIENNDKLAIIGTPGGSRIITMVLHGILAAMEGKTANQVVSQPRYHHQYLPDVIQVEPDAIPEAEQAELAAKGHRFKHLDNAYGNMQLVIWDKKTNKVDAASDPRGEGQARVR